MPRDGSGIYTKPFPDVVTGTTVASTVHNGIVADVETDLNAPRPIIAGGTGANNVTQARDNLDAEVAGAVVTNYDTQVWENGSFHSALGATAAPKNALFSGICHIYDSNNISLEVREYDGGVTLGPKYVRQKILGSWKPWVSDGVSSLADGSQGVSASNGDLWYGVRGTPPASYFAVNTESDLTGADAFTVGKDGFVWIRAVGNFANLVLNKPASAGSASAIIGMRNTLGRWQVQLGDGNAEGGGNGGSHFGIYRYNDAGTLNSTAALSIDRATGIVTTGSGLTTGGDVTASRPGGTQGAVMFGAGNGSARFLHYDGAGVFNLTGGNLNITAGGLIASGNINATNVVASAAVSAPLHVVQPAGGNVTGTATGLKVSSTDSVWGAVFRPVSNTGFAVTFTNASDAAVGTIMTSASATSYNTSSDERLKEDLKSFEAGNIIDDTMVYDFKWKETGARDYGVIAQQAAQIYATPSFHDEQRDRWFIDYSKYVPVILQELKALRARVAELEVAAGLRPAAGEKPS